MSLINPNTARPLLLTRASDGTVVDVAAFFLSVWDQDNNLVNTTGGGGGGGGAVTMAANAVAAGAYKAGAFALAAGVDGWSITDGLTTDTKVVGDNEGTHSSKLRGINTTLSAIALALAGTLTVGGSVSVSNFPATQPVSGTVAVSAVSGSVAVTNAGLSNIDVALSTRIKPTDLNLDGSKNLGVNVQGTVPVSIASWTGLTSAQLALDGSNNLGVNIQSFASAFYDAVNGGLKVSLIADLTAPPTLPLAITIQNAAGTAGIFDTAAHAGYVIPTDGTHNTPAGDAAARGRYSVITDLTNTAAVKAASTPAGSSDPALVVIQRTGSKTVTQVSVASTATQILASNTNRKGCTIINAGASSIWLGSSSGVTTSNGFELKTGAVMSDFLSTDAWYGIVASTSMTAGAIEVA